MSDECRDRARRMHAAIKEVLLNEWDPIGVKEIAEAQDEYDGYVPTIYKMLIQQRTEQEIFDYLWWAETDHMGLAGNRQATEAFAERLVSLASDL
jgi:hypothetical protein